MTKAPLIHTAPETLLALRAALMSRGDLDTVFVLRDAGYAGGEGAFAAFEDYVRDIAPLFNPQSLPLSKFFQYASEYFTQSGWGSFVFKNEDDAFCLIEIEDCWEANPENQPEPAGCHMTLGYLAAFLGHFADYPISILEIEGPSTGSSKCQLLAGNTQRIAEYYKQQTQES